MQSQATSTTDTALDVSSLRRPKRRWEVTRLGFAIVYLLGALAHVVLGLLAPEVYEQFADEALLGGYTAIWTSFVVPNLWFLQPLVIVFEFGLGLALLWRGRVVRVGHAAGAVFQAGLILSGPWGPINAGLAVIHLEALRMSYPKTIVDVVRRHA